MGEPVTIEFIIDPATGLVESITPKGVVGPACKAITEPFERLFGGAKTDDTLPEMYVQEEIKQQAKIGGNYGV
jgi:hypothetical protein